MNVQFMPDLRMCRLCGATFGQREFWPEQYLRTGQTLRRCGQCSGLYLGPDFTERTLLDFYSGEYRRIFPTESPWLNEERFFRMRCDDLFAGARQELLAPLLPQGGHLFELGSGFGSFLGALGATRPDAKLFAYELDRDNRERRLKGAPVTFFDTYHLASSQRFNVVAAFHVLEHLPDPLGFLDWAVQSLESGGRAIIEVPDAMCDWTTRKFVHPAHLTYFSAETLARLGEAAGFDVVRCGPHPGGRPFRGTIWAEMQKPDTPVERRPVTVARKDEVVTMDCHVERYRWGLKDSLKHFLKQGALSLVKPGLVGEMQRWLEYRRRKNDWDGLRSI